MALYSHINLLFIAQNLAISHCAPSIVLLTVCGNEETVPDLLELAVL